MLLTYLFKPTNFWLTSSFTLRMKHRYFACNLNFLSSPGTTLTFLPLDLKTYFHLFQDSLLLIKSRIFHPLSSLLYASSISFNEYTACLLLCHWQDIPVIISSLSCILSLSLTTSVPSICIIMCWMIFHLIQANEELSLPPSFPVARVLFPFTSNLRVF